jgi:hypothetical protein
MTLKEKVLEDFREDMQKAASKAYSIKDLRPCFYMSQADKLSS